ncbi:MAG: alpha/beta hydrolase [Candidatus Moraniibacteriota bacterium]|nr:MAG: alpha/beta hydrolase [Candidatus Moranbacteria bacterium]
MKNAIILHGTGTKKDEFWFPYLKNELEKLGYDVWLPQLPNDEHPNRMDWLPFILSNGTFTEETVLIGHSAGAQVILSVLEKIDVKIKKAILVSGYAKLLRESAEGENEEEPHWDVIRPHAKEFIFINSDNDPWGCDDTQGKIMADNLGGKLIVRHDGHMGSTTYNQPYKEFPLLVELIKS